jgi:iron complex transport system substrate-binding protein
MRFFGAILAFSLLLASCSQSGGSAEDKKDEVKKERIVSLGGSITEVIYALGAQDQLVAVDVTSTYPAEAEKLTNLGHVSGIRFEGVLSTKPTEVFGFRDEINPDLVKQLKDAGVKVVLFDREFTVDGTKKVISAIEEELGMPEGAKKLNAKIDSDVKGLEPLVKKPKVLFVYARGAGTMMVAGDGTPLTEMIRLAGGQNAATGFTEYKPLTTEGVIAANPDVILMFDSGQESLSSEGGILGVPGVSATTAGKNKAVITMDGQYLSGFGPRVGQALSDLNDELSKIK